MTHLTNDENASEIPKLTIFTCALIKMSHSSLPRVFFDKGDFMTTFWIWDCIYGLVLVLGALKPIWVPSYIYVQMNKNSKFIFYLVGWSELKLGWGLGWRLKINVSFTIIICNTAIYTSISFYKLKWIRKLTVVYADWSDWLGFSWGSSSAAVDIYNG